MRRQENGGLSMFGSKINSRQLKESLMIGDTTVCPSLFKTAMIHNEYSTLQNEYAKIQNEYPVSQHQSQTRS
jgi:hypothetical protein